MRTTRWVRLAVLPCSAALAAGFFAAPQSATAVTGRHVRPGAGVTLAQVKCKVGLLLHQGKTVYAAVPASCGALPSSEGVPQWGCGPKPNRQTAASAPVGSTARIAGAQRHAIVAYDSFIRMQALGTKKVNKCQFNDLILLRLSRRDARRASGQIPGSAAPTAILSHPPAAGTSLSLGGAPATAAASTHHGWVYPLSTAPHVTASDVGTSLTRGTTLVGMLTAIPQGTVMTTPAAAYNLHRAIRAARHAPCVHYQVKPHKYFHACFDRLALLRAGQRA